MDCSFFKLSGRRQVIKLFVNNKLRRISEILAADFSVLFACYAAKAQRHIPTERIIYSVCYIGFIISCAVNASDKMKENAEEKM